MKIDLTRIELPNEHEARERAWRLVTRAYAEHEPRPVTRSRRRPVVLALTATASAALIAVAVSPAGSSIVHSVREAVGISKAAPALTQLPTGGQLLVDSGEGPWIVQPNGSKRLLGNYQQASWSPHGLFVAVTHAHELLAVDPHGTVRWSLARPGTVSLPRWAPDGYRIAYLDGSTLRIVAGDGTGDRRFASSVAHVAPVWQPNAAHLHVLAFVSTSNELYLSNADTNELLARHHLPARPFTLLWTTDGKRLVAISAHLITAFDNTGRKLGSTSLGQTAVRGVVAPGAHRLAIDFAGAHSEVVAFDLDRLHAAAVNVFSGVGSFSDLAWSPDAHWLLIAWPSADQWVFVHTGGTQRIAAVSAIASQFEPGRSRTTFPGLAGWCCTP